LTGPRLASGFWVAAKLRQIQSAGGYASILVKGHDEAGTINLVLRNRGGALKLAVPVMATKDASSDRSFEWRGSDMDDQSLSALIENELRFDRDQWFVECECPENQFIEIFNVKSA
jgi:hypothetical protein